MKLIVNELGLSNDNELFQEITVGDHSRFVTNIRPHLYRHNSPAGSLRMEVRDLNDQVAATSDIVAISSIDPGNDFFHGEIRFSLDFGFQAGASYRVYLVGVSGYTFSESAYIGWCRDFDLRKYPVDYTPATGMNSALLMELWDNRFSREGFENEGDSP